MVEAGSSNFKCEVLSRSSSRYGLEHGVGVVHRANVDLEYYKFKLDDVEITQLQAIELILAECEMLLLNKDDAKNRFNKKIWNLIVDILPHMWW